MSVVLLITQLPVYLNALQRIALSIAVITYLIEFVYDKKWKHFKWTGNASQWFFVSLIFYFLLQFLYLPFEVNMSYFGRLLEQRVVFAVIGIIGLFGLNQYFKLKYIAWTFVLSSTALGLFLLAHLNKEILASDIRNTLIGLVRIKYINNHMMFNFYLNVSLVFCFYLFLLVKNTKAFWTKCLILFSSVVILSNLLISDGRTGAFASIVILLLIILHLTKKKNNFVIIGSIAALAVITTAVFLSNSRVNIDFIKNEPRYKIWAISMQELEKSKFIGEGASTATYNVDMALRAEGLQNKHSHNQLIQTTIEYGIIGTLAILAIFVTAIFSVEKTYRFLVVLILIAAIAQLMMGTFMKDFYPACLLLPLLMIIHQQKTAPLTPSDI